MTRRRRTIGFPSQSAPAPSLGARDPRTRTNAQSLASRSAARRGVRMEDDGSIVSAPGDGLEVRDDDLLHVVVDFPLVVE